MEKLRKISLIFFIISCVGIICLALIILLSPEATAMKLLADKFSWAILNTLTPTAIVTFVFLAFTEISKVK